VRVRRGIFSSPIACMGGKGCPACSAVLLFAPYAKGNALRFTARIANANFFESGPV